MAKRYVCVNCQADFELEDGAEVRCPKCLRTHGIDAAASAGNGSGMGTAAPRSSRTPIAVGVATLAIAAVVVVVLATRPRETAPGTGGPGTAAASEAWFNATADLKAFAKKATAGANDDAAKTGAVFAAVRDLLSKLRVDDVAAGAARPPLAPDVFLKDAQAGTLKEAYAFEVASLAAAALQVAGGKGQIALLSQERPRVLPQKDTAGDIGEFVLVASGSKAWSAATLKEVPAPTNAETLDAAGVRAEQLNVEAIYWLRQKDTFKANQANEQAIKLSKAANILITRAYLMVQNSSPKEAVALATKAVETALGRGDYHYVLAVSLLAAREPRRAAVAIDKALAAYADFPSALIAKGMIAIAEAQEVAQGGAKSDADGGATAEDPETRVQALLKKASESFSKAAEIAPKYGPAHLALAEAKLLAGDTDGAKEAIGKALEIDPKLAEAHLKLAALHMQSRDVAKAKASIEEALKLEPKRVDARLMLAAILAESGDAAMALAEAKKASETDKGSREAAMFVAKLLFDSGAKEAAVGEARRILAVHPDFEQGRMYLAVLLLKSGQKAEANKEFAEVVRRSADPQAMQKKVDELKELESDDADTGAGDAGATREGVRDERRDDDSRRGSARRTDDDDDIETPSARRDDDLQLRLGGERRRRGTRLLDD